jgi:SNF2 family DNA or RNA helicase
MLCDHPDLIKHSGELYDPNAKEGSKYASEIINESGLFTASLKSPKLSVLKEYVDDFLSTYAGNKIVIFTSYVKMVDIIKDNLGYPASIYTGQMNAKAKELSKLEFQTNPDCRILISSDAGGYGVDLPQANLLINYDMPWNAGLAVQRNGRIRRASSEWKTIVIQNLVMSGSIEERQHDMLAQKLAVANAVVDGEGINDKGGVNMTAGTLRAFLESITV